MIRILHVFGRLDLGGAESRTMDLFRLMDRERVQFDMVSHTTQRCFFDDEIEQLGGHIYRIPRFKVYNYFSYRKAWKLFFAEHNDFQAVHGHMTSTASIYLPIAKTAGVPMTIAHARSAGVDHGLKGVLTRWMRRNLAKKADYLFACSKLAGISVFGQRAVRDNQVVMIPNAIDAQAFVYNEKTREEMREKLGINNRFVIGHVGRFHYAKNHEYLIQVFAAILKEKSDAVLLLLGEGPKMEEMKALTKQLQIEQQVIFLGNRTPVADYYQAMDYFVYPSRYEGLPGTVVEAQASGLHCLISDTITTEVVLGEQVQCMSIQSNPELWAETVLKDLDYQRTDQYDLVSRSGFDCREQAEKMMRFYETGNTEELRDEG